MMKMMIMNCVDEQSRRYSVTINHNNPNVIQARWARHRRLSAASLSRGLDVVAMFSSRSCSSREEDETRKERDGEDGRGVEKRFCLVAAAPYDQ